jgi:hypothetical protein
MGDEFAPLETVAAAVSGGTRAVAKVEVVKDNKVVYTTEPKRGISV